MANLNAINGQSRVAETEDKTNASCESIKDHTEVDIRPMKSIHRSASCTSDIWNLYPNIAMEQHDLGRFDEAVRQKTQSDIRVPFSRMQTSAELIDVEEWHLKSGIKIMPIMNINIFITQRTRARHGKVDFHISASGSFLFHHCLVFSISSFFLLIVISVQIASTTREKKRELR